MPKRSAGVVLSQKGIRIHTNTQLGPTHEYAEEQIDLSKKVS
ncbi:MAG TPA: hypothetical protein VEC99_14145 [Clostridia bacterium]|nr:hypothetical protein [Clostridia bacterium]